MSCIVRMAGILRSKNNVLTPNKFTVLKCPPHYRTHNASLFLLQQSYASKLSAVQTLPYLRFARRSNFNEANQLQTINEEFCLRRKPFHNSSPYLSREQERYSKTAQQFSEVSKPGMLLKTSVVYAYKEAQNCTSNVYKYYLCSKLYIKLGILACVAV